MSVDIATLAIRVDSTEAGKATTDLDKLTEAGKRSNITVDQAERYMRKASIQIGELARETRTASQAASDMANDAMRQANAISQVGNSAGAQRAGMQQLGFQMQDFAVQVAGGTSATRAFAQQLPQAMGAVQLMAGETSKFGRFMGGPWGVALSVAAAALIPLIGKLFEAKSALDEVGYAADSAMAKLRQSLNQASAVSNAATDSIKKVIEAQAAVGQANAAIAAIEASANRSQGFALIEAQRKRAEGLKALRTAQDELNAVQQTASVVIAMQTRNQERLNATEKETRATKPKMTEAERAHIKALKDAQREQEQAIETAKSYAESLEEQAAKFGKSALEIQRMEVAAKAAAAPTAELAQRIREAGAALEAKQIAKVAEDFDEMITRLYDEAALLPLVGKAREMAALQLEKQGKMAEWAAQGLTDLNERWTTYAAARLNGIEQKSVLERDEETARRLREQIDGLIGGLSRMGGMGSIFGDIGSILTDRNPIAAMLSMGGIGAIAGSFLGGDKLAKELGKEFSKTLENTFGLNGQFAETLGGTLANVFQGAGTGAAVGSIMGGTQVQQIGSMLGGAAGQAIGSTIGALGAAGGPIGAVVGAIAGNLLGGLLKQSKSKANVITNGDISGTFGGTGGDYTRGADALSKAVLDNLERLADALGATATGAFKVSIGMRDGNYVYNPTGSGTKASMGAINVGKDSEAAIKGAIQDAISDGVFEGLSAGVERLLKGEGDLEAQLQKALSFQGVFDELEQMKDPQGFDLKQLDKWRTGMDELFAEAGATADEIAQLEELTGLKRKEIVERYSEELANAEEIASQKRALEIQIMELTGDVVGAVAAAREIEKAAADASLHPLLDRRNALQDEAAASAQAAQAAQEAAAAQRAAAERMTDLEIRLAQARGDTATVQLLERTRELAAAQNDAERALLQLIHVTEIQRDAAAAAAAAQQASQQAAADAAAKAAELLRQRTEMQAELLRLQGKEAEAVQLERQLRLQQIDPTLRGLQQLIFAEQDLATAREAATKKVEDARSVLTEAYERESSALRDTIDKFKDLRDTLADFRSSLFTGQGFDSLAVLQGRFNKTSALANTGQEQALRDLPGVAREFLDAARGRASSLVDYQLQVASVARAVDQAMGAADDVVDYNELQLEALDKSVEGLLAVKEEVKSVREAVIELKAAIAEQTGTVQQLGTTQIRVQNETNRTLKNVTEGGYAIKTQAVA